MLSIFSSACWASAFPLWKTVYSVLLPIFNWVDCLFWCWVVWAVYVCWILIPYCHIICKYFLLFSRLSFHSVDGFLCCAKGFKFNLVSFKKFLLLFLLLWELYSKKHCCDLLERMPSQRVFGWGPEARHTPQVTQLVNRAPGSAHFLLLGRACPGTRGTSETPGTGPWPR